MNKKKLLALVLAALMSVSTTVVAFADESTPAATQNAGITVLSESTFPKILGAPLADHAYGGGQQDSSLAESYGLTAATQGADGVYYVTISAYNLKMHTNAEHKLGYWVGLAIFAPEGEDVAKVKYSKSNSIDGGEVIDLETIGDRGDGIAYYVDAGSGTKEYDFTVQWFKEDGSTNVGDPLKFHITLNVTLSEAITVNNENALREALKQGGTITLADDVTLTNPIEIGVAGTTLDLGGHSLVIGDEKSSAASTLAAHDSWVAVTAPDVTITNGTIDARKSQDKYVVCAEQGGSVILNGVTVNSDSTTSGAVANYGTMSVTDSYITGGSYPIVSGPSSTLSVNSGEFQSAENGKGALYANSGSNVELNGGEFMTTTGNTCLFNVNGTTRVGADVTMTANDISDTKSLIVGDNSGSVGKVVVEEGAEITYNGGSGTLNSNEIADAVKENGGSASVVDPSEEEENDRERSGGDYFGNAKWAEVKAQIAAAEEGDTIEMSGTGLPWFPSSVARALKGKDVTLEIRKNGVTYTLNGQKIGPITKIWYNFDENLETTLQPVEE